MSTKKDDYLQKLHELVCDENIIVTYTYLSKVLGINVHDSQNILDKYVKTEEFLNNNGISCTYCIVGTNKNGISITLSREEELKDKRDSFTDIASQHVYSVQKNKEIDSIALANVEPFNERCIRTEPLLGSIVSDKAVKRKLKTQTASNLKSENQTIKQEKVESKTHIKKNSIEAFCTQGNNQSNDAFKSKTDSKNKPKNMMANFLTKGSSKTENSNGDIKKELGVKEDKKSEPSSEENTDNGSQGEHMEVDASESANENKQSSESKTSVKRNKEESVKSAKKSKKRKTDNKSEQPAKKRKRIVETRDSDSDIFGSSESETESQDVVYSDDNIKEEEEKKIEPILPAKTKRMKQITEEFMDEDGYMNTIQKFVVVSDEDEEENEKEQKPLNIIKEKVPEEKPLIKSKENSTKKEISPKKPNKNNKTKAGKAAQNQPSIMNFFKKT